MSVEPGSALDIPDAGEAINAILAREDGDEVAETAAPATAPAEKKAEVPAEATEQETTDAQAEDAPEAEATEEAGEAEEEAAPEPRKYTVKVDGETFEVPEDELVKGYQREQSYTRKSMALADERKKFADEIQAVSQERTTYAQLLPALQAQLEAMLPQAPDPKLKLENPVDYYVLKNEYDEKVQHIQAVKQERQRLAEQAQTEQEAKQHKALVAGNARLLEIIPDWKDPSKRESIKSDLRDYGMSLGFTEEEIANTFDPRAVMALYEGSKARKLLTAKPLPKPVETGPKAAAAGSGVRTPGKVTELTRDKQRLAQTGRVDDAANVFLKMGLA